MKKLLIILSILSIKLAYGQDLRKLNNEIDQILGSKKATVGLAISDLKGNLMVSRNGNKHLPMQSVFKFHIGVVMLSEIDKGKFRLNQKVTIKKEELNPELYSPIRDKYPEGCVLTIAEILQYTISQSDNVACDVLLKLLGGPNTIEIYFRTRGFKNIAISINEETMQSNWDLQFNNWITAAESNKILAAFYAKNQKYLSKASHDFLWKTMEETQTGANRLKGLLPKEIVVAHKTGYSGKHKTTNIYAAVNDIGVIGCSGNKKFIISVLVSDSAEDFDSNERIIAELAKACFDSFCK